MTRDEILAMKAGKELDNALCPLFGYSVHWFDFHYDGIHVKGRVWKTADGKSVNPIPLSTTWEGMRLIVEAMGENNWWLDLTNGIGRYDARFVRCHDSAIDGWDAAAPTAPHAVAIAAMLAVGGGDG